MAANAAQEKRDLFQVFSQTNPLNLLVRVAVTSEVPLTVVEGGETITVLLQPGRPRAYDLLEFASIDAWRQSFSLVRAVESGLLFVDTTVEVQDTSFLGIGVPAPCCGIPPPVGPLPGDFLVWDGAQWDSLTVGSSTATFSTSVISILNIPPNSPALNDRYLIGTAPTHVWVGHDNEIAEWEGTAWEFIPPILGQIIWDVSTSTHLTFTGSSWILLESSLLLANLGGSLGNDSQHGVRGGSNLHALAVPAGAAGFMSGTDKAKLDGIAVSAAALSSASPIDVNTAAADGGAATLASRADHKHSVLTAAPGSLIIGDSAAEGTALSLARSDHTHAVAAPSAPVSIDKSAALAGTATSPARADHKHDVNTAAAGSILVGASSSEGSAMSLARSDHTHALAAPSSPIAVDKAPASAGSSSTVARADHKHDISTAAPSSVGVANAEGSSSSLARADHVHDHGAQTDGTHHAVATGSAAGFLSSSDKTKLDGVASGAAALTSSAPVNVTKSAAVAGSSTDAARADHKHDISTAAPGNIGTTNSEGSSSSLARADHTHNLPFSVVQAVLGTATGSISVNSQQITNILDPTSAQAAATKAYVDSVATGLAPKDAVKALSTTNIASLSGLATTVDGVLLDTDSYRVLLIGQTTATQNGIWLVHSGAWTRPVDFATGSNAASAFAFVEQGTLYANTGWVCTSTAPNAIVDTNNLAFTQFSGAGQFIAGTGATRTGNTLDVNAHADGSIIANADNIQVGILATDAQHGVRGGGTQHAVATTSVAGFLSASDKTKLDGVSSGAAALTSSAPVNVTKATAVVGVAADAARADHKHDISTAAPSSVGTANSEGSSSSLARADHVHNHGAQTDGTLHAVATGSVAGFMSASDKAKLDGVATSATNTPLSSSTPTAADSAAGSAGSSSSASKADHKHQVSTGVPVDVANANSAGTATSLALSDHVHKLPFSAVNTALGQATSAIGFNAQKLSNIADPTSAQDAATKAYVDSLPGSSSTPVWQNVLDFGADPTGVADSYTPIKNAIAAAEALNGGVIYFPKGTYSIGRHDTNSGIRINNDKPLHFLGDGVGISTIQFLAGEYTASDIFLLRIDNNYTTFSNLTFNGNRVNIVRAFTFTVTVQNNTLYSVTLNGVLNTYTSSGAATNTEIVSGLIAAIQAGASFPTFTPSGTTTLIVKVNSDLHPAVTNSSNLTQSFAPSEQTHFMQVEDSHTVKILNCEFRDCIRDGVRLLGRAPDDGEHYVDDCVISGCTFRRCGRSGITCQRAFKNTRIVHNFFEEINDQSIDYEPSASGFGPADPREVVIANNVIHGFAASNVVTLSGSQSTEPNFHLIFANNIIKQGSVQGQHLSNIEIVNNIIDAAGNGTNSGIHILGICTNVLIKGNILTSAVGTDTIYLHQQGGFAPNGVVIVDNIIDVQSGRHGILMESIQDVLVSNNRIRCATNNGITGISFKATVTSFPARDAVLSNNLISGFNIGIHVTCNNNASLSDVMLGGNHIVHRGVGSKIGLQFEKNSTVTFTITPTVQNSALYTVTINGVVNNYTSSGAATATEIVSGLIAAIQAGAAGSVFTESGTITLLLTCSSTPPLPTVTTSGNLSQTNNDQTLTKITIGDNNYGTGISTTISGQSNIT